MNDGFVVRFTLRTPIVLNPSVGLDGILARLVFDRTGDLERAHRKLPLQQREGVHFASQLFLEAPAPIASVPLVRNMKPGMGLTADMVRPQRGAKLPRVRTHRGDFRTLMSRYSAYLPTAVWAFGSGDADSVRELLSDARAIGKKRALGFGEIADMEFEQLAPPALFGLTAMDGSPARILPVDLWQAIGGTGSTKRDYAPVHLPRWQSPQVECVLPAASVVSPARLRAMLGGTG